MVHDQLVVHYQPLFSLQTMRLLGASRRWSAGITPRRHGSTPDVHPDGRGGRADRRASAKSCSRRRARSSRSGRGGVGSRWRAHRRRADDAPLAININVSGVQLAHPGFVDFIVETMARRGVRPGQINLEVTESVLMDAAGVVPAMQRLAGLGIKLSIDDFGTGYSSLSDLHSLPFDTLKIDRSFVDRLGDDGKGQEIVRSIVALGRALGKSLVAEGIETEAQLAMLRELRCDAGQGYYFSKPLAAEAITPMLAVWSHAVAEQGRSRSCEARPGGGLPLPGIDVATTRRAPRVRHRRVARRSTSECVAKPANVVLM